MNLTTLGKLEDILFTTLSQCPDLARIKMELFNEIIKKDSHQVILNDALYSYIYLELD
jgi:hypothetical protein